MPTYETPEPIAVSVRLALGSVQVRASDRKDTVVDLRPGDTDSPDDVKAVQQTRIDFTDGRLKLKGPRPRNANRNGVVEAVIEVPGGSHLEFWGVSVDLRGEGGFGEIMCRAVAGDIQLDTADVLDLDAATANVTVSRVTGRTSVRVGSGDLQLHEVSGPATVQSSSGDVRIGEVTGDLSLTAGGGNITLAVAHGDIAAKAGSGGVTLGALRGGSLVAETSTGRMDIGIADGVAAWLDLQSRTGNVHSSLPSTATPQQGEETVKVEARAISGDILIHRA
ncbi:hypothetical protein SMD44_06515 [Streptomyces alboflavus]|uniref:DUF4097 domain-containing protein n=1 Tax=Streptomyces alboflavus TaxID=67267 RepID=A0A1Z1WKS6_9ACTN|nr:DUF4097 family beta strand repeat-containing protein [Streptomyces alboflavus]ARX87034.1 hypothetical protein SMD44_06515 [Streptomyces alboflavus]